jgi:hypothetical protein
MNRLTFRLHAIQRMFERSITRDDVRYVIEQGEIIREYPDDTPYPSRLMLGWRSGRPLHVVAADNTADNETIIITAYEPKPDQWSADFRTRKDSDS